MKETAAGILANLTGEQGIDVQKKQPPIREEKLRPLREKIQDREEVRELQKLSASLGAARKANDQTTVNTLVPDYIKKVKQVSEAFLQDAEAECATSEMDLPKIRVLINFGNNYALGLAGGIQKDPSVLNNLKEWQTKFAESNPETVRQLVESYKQSIAAEIAEQKPDHVSVNQWVKLCMGFAPALAKELVERLHEAILKRCTYFVEVVEQAFTKEPPDMQVIEANIGVPQDYYKHLQPESIKTISDRVKALEERRDALNKK